jgi:hypothetical protein
MGYVPEGVPKTLDPFRPQATEHLVLEAVDRAITSLQKTEPAVGQVRHLDLPVIRGWHAPDQTSLFEALHDLVHRLGRDIGSSGELCIGQTRLGLKETQCGVLGNRQVEGAKGVRHPSLDETIEPGYEIADSRLA